LPDIDVPFENNTKRGRKPKAAYSLSREEYYKQTQELFTNFLKLNLIIN